MENLRRRRIFLIVTVAVLSQVQAQVLIGKEAPDLVSINPIYKQIMCKDICPLNEIFTDCKAGCQLTCFTQFLNAPQKNCGCVPGCVCKDGFIRDANTFVCIPKTKCPNICPKNEVFNECGGGGCYKTCDSINAQIKCACIRPGCVCKPGYIRSSFTKECIKLAACKICPKGYEYDEEQTKCVLTCNQCEDPNATYNSCGTICPTSCDRPSNANIRCMSGCNPGCFCNAGYLNDTNLPPKLL